MTFIIDNPEGVATTPLRKICLGKRESNFKPLDINDTKMCSFLLVNDHVDVFRFTEIKESYVFKQLKSIS